MMKTSLLAAFGLLACTVANSLAAPLLRYEFNQAGSTQVSTGSASLDLTLLNYNNQATNYIGEAPKKRAGASNRLALNFTSSNVDQGLSSTDQSKGAAQAFLSESTASFLRSGLGSFTITGWVYGVQSADATKPDRRLFSLRNAAGNQIVDFRMYNASGSSVNQLYLGLHGDQGSKLFLGGTGVQVPKNNSEWYFVSVSYNADNGLITFYAGEEGGVLAFSTAFNTNSEGLVNSLLTNATLLGVGNVGQQHQRRLDGYLSDVRFYGEALDAAQIGEIYAIPEPGAISFIGAGGLFVLLGHWKARSR